MPFVAIREDEGGRVYIGDYDDPRQKFGGVGFICTDCHERVGIRMRPGYRPHFWHKPGATDRPCYWRTYAERPEHLLAKRALVEILRADPYFGSGTIEVEYPIDTPSGQRRYIDVYVETEDGSKYAHEAQLAAQTIGEFEQRTADYASLGIEAVWWLGLEAKTTTNEGWCKANSVYVGEIFASRYENIVIDEWYPDENGMAIPRRAHSGNGRP